VVVGCSECVQNLMHDVSGKNDLLNAKYGQRITDVKEALQG